MRPATAPPRTFEIKKLQVFNDFLGKWDDLVRADQLTHGAQLYCFQPNVVDLQAVCHTFSSSAHTHTHARTQDLPQVRQPRHPMAQSVGGGAPGAAPGGASSPYPLQPMHASLPRITATGEREHVATERKVQIVFQELDTSDKGYLDYGDLERGFKDRGLHFAVNTIGELFHKADLNRDGRIMFDEWQTWALVYPNTLDAMYYRGKGTGEEAQITAALEELMARNQADSLAHELLNDLLKKSPTPLHVGYTVKSLNRFLAPIAQALNQDPERDVRPDIQRAQNDLNMDVQERERKVPEYENELRLAQERRHVLEQQEMNLLEHEIRLERTREQMRSQEMKYQEAETLFNNKASETNSPRRARRAIPPVVNP